MCGRLILHFVPTKLRNIEEEGAEYFKQISDEALEGYRSQLEEKGMEFVTPDDPQEWKDAAQTIYSEFTEGNEDLLQEIIDCQK